MPRKAEIEINLKTKNGPAQSATVSFDNVEDGDLTLLMEMRLMSSTGTGGGGGGASDLTVVDLSTATQADLDIDVSGFNRIVAVLVNGTRSGTAEIGSAVSIDGSTYESTAGQYRVTLGDSGTMINGTGSTSLTIFPSTAAARSGVRAIIQAAGFESGAPMVLRCVSSNASNEMRVCTNATDGSILTSAIQKLRIFTSSEFTSGTLYIQRIADASVGQALVDFSVAASPQNISVSSFDAAYIYADNVDGGTSRYTARFSDDNASTWETDVYANGFITQTSSGWSGVVGSSRAAIGFTGDTSSSKHGLHIFHGLRGGLQAGFGASGPANQLSCGIGAVSAGVTNIEFHSQFDGVSLTSGTVGASLHEFQDRTTVASGTASAAASVAASVSGYTECRIVMPDTTLSASDSLLMQVDVGSGYDTTAGSYYTASLDPATEASGLGIAGLDVYGAGTAAQSTIEVFGLGAGMPIAAVCFGSQTSQTASAHITMMIYEASTAAASNLRIISAGGATISGAYEFTANGYA